MDTYKIKCMKKFILFLSLISFFACNNNDPSTPPGPDTVVIDTSNTVVFEHAPEMKAGTAKRTAARAILPTGQVYDTLANGDTLFYIVKDTTVTVSTQYTYRTQRTELHSKKPGSIVNTAPIARAGLDKVMTLPTNAATLDGSGSTDAESNIKSYGWRKISGPAATITDSNKSIARIANLVAGVYVYELRVTDQYNLFTADQVKITVNDQVTVPPGETTALAFSAITTDLNRPAGGAEQWHGQNTVNIPTEGTNTQRLDVYWRFTWARIEKSQGVYDWSYLVNILNTAITKKQKVSFGIMSVYHDPEDGVISYDGFRSSYPQYLHQLMQSESTKDWQNGDGWIPNYNSQHYIARLRALNASCNNLLETGSYNGVPYKSIINSIDVRGYGNYGEWHNGGLVDLVSEIPAGARATTATLKAIIDAHTQTLPNFQLSIIMTAFDANWLQHTMTAPEVGYYALTTRNSYGPLGWRRDNWGATDNYIRDLLVNNTRTFNGVALNSLIMNVWKVAPITGEPMNTAPNEYGDFENQVRLYHAASFGNGNVNQSITTTLKNNFRAASKAAGYRLAPTAGSISRAGVTLTWQNTGVAPTYENWQVIYELIDAAGAVKYSFVSKFKPRLFLPGSTTVTDAFSGVAPGTYKVNMKVFEPYRGNMPLFVNGRNADGSITLHSGLKF